MAKSNSTMLLILLQDRMAEHLVQVLGDLLFTGEVDRERNRLPSPEELKRKILVKGKKIK